MNISEQIVSDVLTNKKIVKIMDEIQCEILKAAELKKLELTSGKSIDIIIAKDKPITQILFTHDEGNYWGNAFNSSDFSKKTKDNLKQILKKYEHNALNEDYWGLIINNHSRISSAIKNNMAELGLKIDFYDTELYDNKLVIDSIQIRRRFMAILRSLPLYPNLKEDARIVQNELKVKISLLC